jgi:predicted  nucleic acid-binding Zn-ribbon protein|uniref:Minor tail protein n=1 Tax=Siphoviridae sp. cttuu15 TaxID=2825709 RepID=A0A8S5U190_9CAUD|nr:MAG TPA: minor tail protein [Siphoviridae sp. cttuu15]
MAADSAGQIGLDLVINQQQFNKQLGGIQNLAKKTGKMLAGAFAVKGLTSFAKDCIELGSDLTEVQNVVDVVFPTMNKKVNEFAQNAASTFGLSETMAKKFTGTFGAMANAFGFSEKESYKMSTALTGLAGDVASFYNISQDEAFTKLKSVFSGETETLKDLGIVMTQTALDQYALANGFGKTTSAMTEQEKVALRYAFVQQQLQNATGDFSRTSDQWANQIRILSLQFDSLKASIGQGLINLFLPIVKVINTVLGKLMTLANAFKSFTAMIMGKKSTGASTSLDKTAASAGKVSDSLNKATGASNSLNKSTKKVGDTAKKTAKKISGLMGFDQINKLTETKGTSGSNGNKGSGTGSAGSGASGGTVDMGSLPAGENEKATKLGKGYDNLRKAIDKLRVAFSAFSKVAIGAFKWIWKNMLVPLGKWTMQKLAPKLIELLAAALNVLTAVCKALQPLWQWAWDHLFKPLANFVGDAIIGFLDLLVKGLNGLANWINKHQGAVQAITVAFLGFNAAVKGIEFLSLIGQMGGAGKAFKALAEMVKLATVAKIKDKAETLYLNALYAKDAVAPFAKSFATLAGKIKLAVTAKAADIKQTILLGTSYVKNLAVGIAKTTVEFVKQAAQMIKNKAIMIATKVAQTAMTIATKAWSAACSIATVVTKAFGIAMAFLTSPIGLVIVAITALAAAGILIYKNWGKIKKTKFGKFLIGIATGFKNLWKWAKKNIHPIQSIKKLWEGIKNKKAKLEAEAKEKVKGALNTLKEGWESVKDKAASLVAEAKEKADGAIANLKEGWESIKDRATTLVAEAKEKANGALDKLHSAWENIKDKGAELIAEAKEKAAGAIDKLKGAWESIKDRGAELIAEAKEKAGGALSKLKSAWESVKDKTATFIGNAIDSTKGKIAQIGNAFKSVKDKTATLKAKAKNSASAAIAKIRKGWNSLKSKTVTLTARVKTAVDSVKGWVNTHIIDKLNGVLSKVKIFGKNPIKPLAQGGYVKKNTPQLAMIGDNRHQGEVVAPENKMIAMAKKAAELSGGSSKDDQIIRLLMELINAVKSIDTDVYLDGKKITKTVNDNNNADIRAGKRPILI